MDEQPTKPVNTEPTSSQPIDVKTPEAVASEPAEPVTSAMPTATIGSSTHVISPAGNPEDAPSSTPPAASPKKASSKKSKVLLIIVIALILAAVVTYLYMKKGNNTTASKASTAASTTATKASPSDVSDTINNIDSTVKTADGTGDLSSSDLNNSSLGL